MLSATTASPANLGSLAAYQAHALPANLGPLTANQAPTASPAYLVPPPPANQGTLAANQAIHASQAHLMRPPPANQGHQFNPPPFSPIAASHVAAQEFLRENGQALVASPEEQISLATSILHSHGLSFTVAQQTTWERRAAARALQAVDDPSMPFGFDRIDIHAKIERAIQERTAKGNLGLQMNAKKVNWPVMAEFDQKSFVECRMKYYECVLSSILGGIFQPWKDCLEIKARVAACATFDMDDVDFFALSDAEFMSDCISYFGPKNASQALQALSLIRIDKHDDRTHSQADFVAKFDKVALQFLLAVNDFAKCQENWTVDVKSTFGGTLSIKDIMNKWYDVFPRQGFNPASRQIAHCRAFFDRNKKTAFKVQVRLLRNEFQSIDMQVAAKERAYVSATRDVMEAVEAVDHHQAFHQSRTQNRVADVSARANRQPEPSPRSGQSNKSFNDKPRAPPSSFKNGGVAKPRRVIAGHLRCQGCGSINNHYGLGYTKDSCPLFNTKHAMKAGHVWKSSADEPSVVLKNGEYGDLLAANPKIGENWKKAKMQRRTFVAALSVNDDESMSSDADPAPVGRDDDMSGNSDSDNKSSDYFHSSALLANIASIADAHIDATTTSEHVLAEFGHEDQFFGAARFANNNDLVAQTLLDPGATINIINPMFADRSCIQRRSVNVQIFQGKKKQCTVNEMVQCVFELLQANGTYVQHLEWFAVCDMGYALLLGRKFCRLQGFTCFDDKLTSFNTFAATQRSNAEANVAVLESVPLNVSIDLKFLRVDAPQGEARNKRHMKKIRGDVTESQNVIGRQLLQGGSCPLSSLKVVERTFENDIESVRLQFQAYGKKASSCTCEDWFVVTKDHDRLYLNQAFVKQHALADFVSEKPVTETAVVCSAPQSNGDFSYREPSLYDGASVAFLSSNKPRRAEGPNRLKPHYSKRASNQSFVSFHPVSGYRLTREAMPPLSPHWKRDHLNFKCNESYKANKQAVVAAYEAAMNMASWRKKERLYKSMLKSLDKVNSASNSCKVCQRPQSFESCIDVISELEMLAHVESTTADTIEPELSTSSSVAAVDQEFKCGEYVLLSGAINKPEFEGQRARLYNLRPSDPPGTWTIRVLGKNGDLVICHDSLFRKLSTIEQQRSVPSGAKASFSDVGIDEAGFPDAERKLMAHRQFGEEYSESLSRKIEALKSKFPTVFTEDVSEPCLFEPMKINLIPNAILPTKARWYRNTPRMRDEIRRQIQEQLDWGCIRKCVTPHVSDVLLVKRPHMPGKFRFVVSYIKLNEATVKEQLIMPDPKSQHERLQGCTIFGALDFSSYYRQIRLHEESQLLTGFASDEGTFCYTRVPMGITGACQYAQKVLQEKLAQDKVLGPLGLKNYFDDLPFGANSEEQFLFILEALLNFCVKWRLKVNPSKSVLGVKSITHVGFIVSKDGIAIDPERTRDISELEAPRSIKKVQSVLGIFNYVRQFIPNFADKAKFLSDKLVAQPSSRKRPASVLSKVAALDAALLHATSRKIKSVAPFL